MYVDVACVVKITVAMHADALLLTCAVYVTTASLPILFEKD